VQRLILHCIRKKSMNVKCMELTLVLLAALRLRQSVLSSVLPVVYIRT